jgi:actin-related protein
LSFFDTEQVKHSKCFIANDYEHNITEFNTPEKIAKHTSEFELPDGSILQLHDETFLATEVLMKPELLGPDKNSQLSLTQLIEETLKKVNFDLRRDINENLCLAGGNLDVRNMDRRFEADIKSCLAGSHLIEILEA